MDQKMSLSTKSPQTGLVSQSSAGEAAEPQETMMAASTTLCSLHGVWSNTKGQLAGPPGNCACGLAAGDLSWDLMVRLTNR